MEIFFIVLLLNLGLLVPWAPLINNDVRAFWPRFFLFLERKEKFHLLFYPISFALYVFDYGQFSKPSIYNFWLILSLGSMGILSMGRLTFLCYFSGVAHFHWLYLLLLSLAMVLASSLRLWLSLCIVLYSRLWAFSPERLKLLGEENLLLHGRYSPIRDAARFAWQRTVEGGSNSGGPRFSYWNKTNIAGGLFIGTSTAVIGGYVAYESYLTRIATERQALAAEIGASAAERAASAAEVQAGVKTVEEHRKSFPGR